MTHVWRQLPKFGGEPSTTSQEVDGEMSTLTRLPQSEPTINISFRIVKMTRINLAKNMMNILMMFLKLSIARCENETLGRFLFIDEILFY